MINKITKVSFTIHCKKCKKVFDSFGDHVVRSPQEENKIWTAFKTEMKNSGWEWSQSCFSSSHDSEKNSITETMCPECAKKHKKQLCESSDIRDRISGGFYEKKMDLFKADIFKMMKEEDGIVESKAEKIWYKAYEKGDGYFGILNEIESLIQLINEMK